MKKTVHVAGLDTEDLHFEQVSAELFLDQDGEVQEVVLTHIEGDESDVLFLSSEDEAAIEDGVTRAYLAGDCWVDEEEEGV